MTLLKKLRGLLPPYSVRLSARDIEDELLAALAGKPYKKAKRSLVRRAASACFMAYRRGANAVYYWVHYRVRRYDLVRTDLGYRYADVDHRMFLACFALLGEFVEHELGRAEDGEGYRGYNLHRADEEGRVNPERKAIDLWLWYVAEREGNFNPLFDDDPTAIEHDALYDRRLRELIDIRRALWT